MQQLLKVWWANIKLQMDITFSRPTFQFSLIFQPMLYATMIYYLYRGQNDLIGGYLLGGVSILNIWDTIMMSSAGDIERERFRGTLENLFISPLKFIHIMTGKVIGNTLLSLFSILIVFVFSYVILGVRFHIANPVWFLLSFILLIMTLCSLGLFLAGCFAVSRNARAYLNCMGFPIYILCGLVFPIDVLPNWIHPLSCILSPTWGLKCMMQAIHGINNFAQFRLDIMYIVLLMILYTVLCKFLYNVLDVQARRDGKLGVY